MFRNRGELPNINNNSNNNTGYSAPHYSHYWNGRYFIIYYDKTFIAIELALILIIILTAIAVYLYAYQTPFNDPIISTKNSFLTTQLILIGISLLSTVLFSFISKNKDDLVKILNVIAILSIFSIVIMFGVKMYLDNKYDENTFKEFYEKYEKSNSNSNTMVIGFTGLKLSTYEQEYIDASINSYNKFSLKATIYMIIHVVIVITLFYLSHRLYSIERKKEKVSFNDNVLFDDEENIKF